MPVVKRTTTLVISTIVYALMCLRDLVLRMVGIVPRRPSAILYYHVVPREHRARFAAQMDVLLRWAKPMRADIAGPVDASVRHIAVTFDDASDSVIANALPELEKRQIPCTIFAISGLLGRQVSWDEYSDCIMSPDQLKSLDPRLITIGSHTVSHPVLTSLTEDTALTELRESRSQLEYLLRRKVALFSFPFGIFTNKLLELCHDAGYERVFTTRPSSAFGMPAQFVCGRVRVDPTDWPLEFYLKIVGAYRWLPRTISIKRKLVSRFRTQQQWVGNGEHTERA